MQQNNHKMMYTLSTYQIPHA